MLEDEFRKRNGDRVSSAAEGEFLNFRQIIVSLSKNESRSERTNVLQQGRMRDYRAEFTIRERVLPTECTCDQETLEFQCCLPKRGRIVSKVADDNIKVFVYNFADRWCPASLEEVFVI